MDKLDWPISLNYILGIFVKTVVTIHDHGSVGKDFSAESRDFGRYL